MKKYKIDSDLTKITIRRCFCGALFVRQLIEDRRK